MEGINIYPPIIKETITVEGTCVYSDGKPMIEGLVRFEAEKTADGIDGEASADTDSTGRFSIKILKGLKGKVYGEVFAYSGKYENCPKLEELLKNTPRVASIRTNAIEIQGDNNLAASELRYPFPACKKAK